MAVTITEDAQQAVKAGKPITLVGDVVTVQSTVAVDVKTIDRFCMLSIKLAAADVVLEPLRKEVKALETQILDVVDQVIPAADEVPVLSGNKFSLQIGAKGKKTIIREDEVDGKAEIIKIIGIEAFIKLAKITMEDLNMYLSGEQVGSVTKTDHVNKRRVKILENLKKPKKVA
jgi:hypothetical protein